MSDDQARMTFLGAQPAGTGPLCRDLALQFAYAAIFFFWLHCARCALSRGKAATGVSDKLVLTGPGRSDIVGLIALSWVAARTDL